MILLTTLGRGGGAGESIYYHVVYCEGLFRLSVGEKKKKGVYVWRHDTRRVMRAFTG